MTNEDTVYGCDAFERWKQFKNVPILIAGEFPVTG